MNILFINPPNMPFTSRHILIEPIDLLHISTYIKSLGFNVNVLDMDVFELTHLNLESYNPELVIIVWDYHIPLHNEDTFHEIKNICSVFNRKKIPIILGGKSATFDSSEKLLKEIDVFIRHDLEKPLSKLIELISSNKSWKDSLDIIPNIRYWNNNELINTRNLKEPIDLNIFPIPDRSLLDLKKYIDVRTILSSRGCNLKCTFCHVPNFWGKWTGKDAKHIVNEIFYLKEQYNSNKILFLDDNFIVNSNRVLEISNSLIKYKSKIPLGCLGTIINFNENIFTKMYEAGFRWIHYGAESGNDLQLKLMNKKTTSAMIKNVVDKSINLGFRVRTSWILDLPNLTIESLKETENLILEHNANEIRLHFLTLRLGSFLYNQHLINTNQYIHSSKQNLNISGISTEDIYNSLNRILIGLKNKGYIVVTNPDDFNDIAKTESSNNFKIVSLCPLRYGINWKY